MVKFTNILLRAAFLALSSLSSMAKAESLKVVHPSSSFWWVAKSPNELSWTCEDSTVTDFTVLLANEDPAVLAAPLVIIADQDASDCSIIISKKQSDLPASAGYMILLANPLNNSDIFATSQLFEIKPYRSSYPE